MGRRLDPRFKRLSGCELDYWTIFTKVNQRVNGGTWVKIGAFGIAAGTSVNVLLRNDGANGFVSADAVQFVLHEQPRASSPPAIRHPQASSAHLFTALQSASQSMPLITRFFWGDIDLKWFPEACWSHPKSKNNQGYYNVIKFMEGNTMPGANVLCIREWRKRLTKRAPLIETTPLDIAEPSTAPSRKPSPPSNQK
jgi:hypothetical protein